MADIHDIGYSWVDAPTASGTITSRSETRTPPVLPPVIGTPPRITVTPPRDMLPQSGTGYYWPSPPQLNESPAAPPSPDFAAMASRFAAQVERLTAERDALRADAERWREAQEMRAAQQECSDDEMADACERAQATLADMTHWREHRGMRELMRFVALRAAVVQMLDADPRAVDLAISQARELHRRSVAHRAYDARQRLARALCAPETDAERAARAQLKEKT